MELFASHTKNIRKELEHLQWALGIEHEMQIYHVPSYKDKNNVEDFILFDSQSATNRVIKLYEEGKIELKNDEYDFLKNMVFESSGRVCNKKFVVKPAPYLMPEFISWNPFCNIRKERYLYHLVQTAIEVKFYFYKLLMKDPVTKALVEKYGDLSEYPYGMTRYMSVPKKIIEDKQNSKYTFSYNKKNQRLVRTDYTGSYHITYTLPHTEKTTDKEFIDMHMNFGNQIQWLEPIMLAGFFSGDEYAIGTKENRVRGSFRVMTIGWGNLAGSDIRLFGTKGIGRYAKTPNYWRKGLKFYEGELLEPCIAPSPSAIKEDGITSLSSDLRTFGSRDPKRPEHRESGLPMSKPNGIEIRIFDNIGDNALEFLTNFIGLIAENSRVTKTKGYVYRDKDWINALHEIMKNGYFAELSKTFINKLRKKLGLKINTTSIVAKDIFLEIYKELYSKNINGLWSDLFFGTQKDKKDVGIMINRYPINLSASLFALMMKLNRNPNLLHSFNQLSLLINQTFESNQKKIYVKDIKIYIKKLFNKEWLKNVNDILQFYKYYNFIDIDYYNNGTINYIDFKQKIPLFENFNDYIINNFQKNFDF